MLKDPKKIIKGYYKDYKNNFYKFVDFAIHHKTGEEFVAYYALEKKSGTAKMMVYPLAEITEKVEVNGREVPRFELIIDEDTEHVVLVDEKDKVIGLSPKHKVHTDKTPLHRAFSCFLFNKNRELLLQQRSHLKITWPLVWANSCSGHPQLFETSVEAAKRRMATELGLYKTQVHEFVSDYRFQYKYKGVVENEICPILAGYIDSEPNPNKSEIEQIEWKPWKEFLEELKQPNHRFTEWCAQEARHLQESPEFNKFLENLS